jgi:hypothetical protein
VLAASAAVLAPLFRAALVWPFSTRALILVGTVFVIGWSMGRPFPLAMRALIGQEPHVLAWAQATNAFASVVASLLAVPIALVGGFRAVSLTAALCYLVSTAACFVLARSSQVPATA